VGISGLLVGVDALAARPMITDDARIVDAESCQVESWAQFFRGRTETWALPGCNVAGRLELTLGGALTIERGHTRATDVLLQGKTVFMALEPNGWSVGVVLGNARHRDIDRGRLSPGDLYAYMPSSFSFRDDRVVLHTNLGWLGEIDSARHRFTWGVGSETKLFERMWMIAETFGQNGDELSFQAGLRCWVVPNRVQIDATFGNRLGEAPGERWLSFGLRLLSPAFLP